MYLIYINAGNNCQLSLTKWVKYLFWSLHLNCFGTWYEPYTHYVIKSYSIDASLFTLSCRFLLVHVIYYYSIGFSTTLNRFLNYFSKKTKKSRKSPESWNLLGTFRNEPFAFDRGLTFINHEWIPRPYLT